MGCFRGYISRQHTIWCGICGNWEQVDEQLLSSAKRRFKNMCWKWTKENGWVCKPCQNKLKTQKTSTNSAYWVIKCDGGFYWLEDGGVSYSQRKAEKFSSKKAAELDIRTWTDKLDTSHPRVVKIVPRRKPCQKSSKSARKSKPRSSARETSPK